MLNSKIVKQSFLFSSIAVVYIALVSTIMNNAERIFGQQDKSVLAPIVFLLLLVISVAMMGTLIFGKPLMLYIDGKRREAVEMVICTIVCLMIYVGLILVALALFA